MFENMSWRHTVTFFNLHLAYGLGYKNVLLTGFDHSYIQPKGVVEQELIKSDENDLPFSSQLLKEKSGRPRMLT